MPDELTCLHCKQPIYYSWGSKVWAHEGNRPSKVAAQKPILARNPNTCLPSTWAKWTPCEDEDGNLIGKNATHCPEPNTDGAGI